MTGSLFPNAVVQAMTLLDECADDIEMAQTCARAQFWAGDMEASIWWGEVLEALGANQKNQA
jgi:hypothetical protein